MQNLGQRPFPSPSHPQADLEVVDSAIYGEMWAPSTLAEFNLLVEHMATYAGDIQGWRGQAGDWTLDSSAVRRLSKYVAHPSAPGGPVQRDSPYMEDVVRNYEAMILEQARVAGHHRREGREWSDLELLALLQHNGAATRLLDFTRNVFIALWFACENVNHKDEYGVVVGTDLNSVRHHWLRQAETQTPLHQLLDQYSKQDEEHLLIYQPEALFERMRAQQGFFMFGKAMPNPWGSLPAVGNPPADYFYGIPGPAVVIQQVGQGVPSNQIRDLSCMKLDFSIRDDFKRIAISPALKSLIRLHSGQVLGYHPRLLLPDLPGFCQTHGSNQPLDWESLKFRP